MDDRSEVNPPDPPEPKPTRSRAEPKTKALAREGLSSLSHWRRTQNGIPQRFYIGFCLYMSAVQDGSPAASVRKFTLAYYTQD
jgi:hypothetical protein